MVDKFKKTLLPQALPRRKGDTRCAGVIANCLVSETGESLSLLTVAGGHHQNQEEVQTSVRAHQKTFIRSKPRYMGCRVKRNGPVVIKPVRRPR